MSRSSTAILVTTLLLQAVSSSLAEVQSEQRFPGNSGAVLVASRNSVDGNHYGPVVANEVSQAGNGTAVTIPATPVITAAVIAPTSSTQGWVGPQTADISAVSLGPNGKMNGFLPFCPSPTNCSVIYKDISAEPVDTVNDGYFKAYSNYGTAALGANFEDTNASLPWYVYTSTDPTLSCLPGETHYSATHGDVYNTESDDKLSCTKPDMVQEGGGNPNVAWTGDGRDRHIGKFARDLGMLDDSYQEETVGGKRLYDSNTTWNLLQPFEQQNTNGRTSADAAGFPQLAMSVNGEDLAAGEIKHALRITVPHTSCAFYDRDTYGLYASPAAHQACGGGGDRVAYMGEWLRIKASKVMPAACGKQGAVIFQAGKKHGFIVADNGRFGLVQGTYDSSIHQADVQGCLSALSGNDLEVIQVQGAKVVAGELNPEDTRHGVSIVFDETGKNKANAVNGNPTTCAADAACGKGKTIPNSPQEPTSAVLTVTPSTVAIGSTVSLAVSCPRGNTITIGGVANAIFGSSGRLTDTPQNSTSYTATCRNKNGYIVSNTASVVVTGPQNARPAATPAAGQFSSSPSVALATATSGAVLHYTVDGSAPSANSATYVGAVPIPAGVTKLQVVAVKPGSIISQVYSGTYVVQAAGATPSTVGTANSGGLTDAASRSFTYNFAGGTSAVLTMNFTNGAALPVRATCGGVSGTLIGSQIGVEGPKYTVAAYYLPNIPGGQQTCTAVWKSSVYATVAVTEVVGASGVDSNVSIGTTTPYPALSCGSLTTTGTNRLAMAIGQVQDSYVTASRGYSQIYSIGNSALATRALPGVITQAVTLNTNNASTDASCVAFALHP